MRTSGRSIFEFILSAAVAWMLLYVINSYLATPYRVEQESMRQTLEPGDFILLDRLAPRFGELERGQIVVFRPPGAEGDIGRVYVKRIIGLPGETIEVHDGAVWVNGNALSEPYVFEGPTVPAFGRPTSWQLGPDEYLLLGDHRTASEDSRSFGPVELERIIGRTVLRYWPPSRLGGVE